ncbi:MAG: hypothetical protein N3B18_09815 [Desulfobacterota bacterium]|nr:hypothetical protein [Thermodesulfobacteriota bacterium]
MWIRPRNILVVHLWTRALIVLCLCSAVAGCTQVLDKSAALFAPHVEIVDLAVETPEAVPQETARSYVIKRLNATQYGVALYDAFSRAAKLFDFNDMYVRMQHKQVRGILKREDTYLILLLNTCKSPDGAGIHDFFERAYAFSSRDEAQRVYAALVAVGVRPCCDEGCDE